MPRGRSRNAPEMLRDALGTLRDAPGRSREAPGRSWEALWDAPGRCSDVFGTLRDRFFAGIARGVVFLSMFDRFCYGKSLVLFTRLRADFRSNFRSLFDRFSIAFSLDVVDVR